MLQRDDAAPRADTVKGRRGNCTKHPVIVGVKMCKPCAAAVLRTSVAGRENSVTLILVRDTISPSLDSQIVCL